ncbi:MAG: AMP-binding protein [Gillisia sp.]
MTNEKASKAEIKRIQWLELQKQLLYLQRNSVFYQEVFRNNGIDISRIKNYLDFKRIPITRKEDLQQQNEKFLCVPKSEIIDYVTTSGTLGEPVSLALNDHDLERLATNEMNSFKMVGVEQSDTVQITTTLDRRFMAGIAYFLGLRKLGAAVVRAGSGVPQLQWDSIARFKPKFLVAVPSFLLKMIEYAEANSIAMDSTSVKAVICIGEPIRNKENELNALGAKIHSKWQVELFSTYASTEMATAFTECNLHCGNHLQPDLIYTEILNEEGEPVKEGEIGELVFTSLQTQTMPLLRFATGDMLAYTSESCGCGRNTLRLSPVMGRKQQMIKLKGTSLYPQHIINVMNENREVADFIIEVRTGEHNLDKILIKIPTTISDEKLHLLKADFQGKLQVLPDFIKVPEQEIQMLKFDKSKRKPSIFIDLRVH